MDLNTLSTSVTASAEAGRTITILDGNGDPYLALDEKTPCTITVLGKASKAVKAARDANQRRILRARRAKLEPADLREGRVRIVVAAITAWTGWSVNGAEAPLTPENVRKLVESDDDVLEQIEEEINDGFFESSSST